MSDPKRAIQAVTGKVSQQQSKSSMPNIPAVPTTQDAGLANFLSSVKLWIEKASGSGIIMRSDLERRGIVPSMYGSSISEQISQQTSIASSSPATSGSADPADNPIVYIGSFPEPPSPANRKKNEVYCNTIDGNSYIWNGGAWRLFVPKGDQGPVGLRGNVQISATYDGTAWDAGADAAATAAIIAAGYEMPIDRDIVTLHNDAAQFSEARYFYSGTWMTLDAYISGNMLVTGSVSADKIDARGLVIKDIDGNVIFGAGHALDVSLVSGLNDKINEFVASTIWLSASSQIISFDGKGNLSPASQVITLTVDTQNITGEPSFSANACNPDGSVIAPMQLVGTGNTRTLDAAQMAYYQSATSVVVVVTVGSLQDTLTIAKVSGGTDGELYSVVVESTNGEVFKPGQPMTTLLKAHVFRNGVEVTDSLPEGCFRWRRVSYYQLEPPYDDATWNALYASGYKQISVTTDAVTGRATFHCDIINA